MKIVSLLLTVIGLIMGNVQTQIVKSSKTTYENRKIINNKKFHVLYEEVAIDKSVDEVWNEVAGNFASSEGIAYSIIDSGCLSGDITSGLGAERFLKLDFQGKTIELKERIIDFKECGDHREFTYDVYESKGAPLNIKTYNTWVVKKGDDGRTYLGTFFTFRARPAILTAIVGKQLTKSRSLKNGLLTYKHYLETGEKKVKPERLQELYSL